MTLSEIHGQNGNKPLIPLDSRCNAQDQRVTGVFQSCQNMLSRIEGTLSFVAFRVLEWVHPFLGPRLENVFLRIKGVWQGILNTWKQERDLNCIQDLQVSHYELQQKVGNQAQLTQAMTLLKEENRQLLQEREATQKREQAIEGVRGILLKQIEGLKQGNQQLLDQNKSLADVQIQNQALIKNLQNEGQAALDFRLVSANLTEMHTVLSSLAKALLDESRMGHQTNLDSTYEKFFSLCLQQIEQAETSLQSVQALLPKDSTIDVALLSFGRILGGLKTSLPIIPRLASRSVPAMGA